MKKLLYTFLAVSIIFAACKKEEENNNPPTSPASIVGVWTPTSVVLDSSLTTTIDGEIVYELGGEVVSWAGSETMTPEEAGFEGNIEFTDDGLAITDDTSSYTYSNNVLTIDEDLTFTCSLTSTSLSLTMEESMDTSWVEPGLGSITIVAYVGQTIHCSRNTITNTNVSQRVGKNNHCWFVKPKFDNIIKSIKK